MIISLVNIITPHRYKNMFLYKIIHKFMVQEEAMTFRHLISRLRIGAFQV